MKGIQMSGGVSLNGGRGATKGAAEGFRVRIGGGPRAAGRARTELARLKSNLGESAVQTLSLLVTELVTNAVRHAGAAAVELVVTVDERTVRVEVGNPGLAFQARVGSAGGEEEPSWGLFLVDRLSDRWGALDEAGYQRVWFEIGRR